MAEQRWILFCHWNRRTPASASRENASPLYRRIEASGAIEVPLHRRGPRHIPAAVFGLRGVVEVPGSPDMLCCHLDDSSTSLMLSNHEGTTLLYRC